MDGFVQERRNSTANALELCLSRTNPSLCANALFDFQMIEDCKGSLGKSAVLGPEL